MTRPYKQPIYRSLRICQCGCGEEFPARLNYRHRDKNGKATYPTYKRGHHPNCRKTQTVAGWNAGLTKNDHPSIERMGYQPGHAPFNDWSHANEAIKNDPNVRARWIESKMGQVPWNKGLTVEEYSKKLPRGPSHGNWLGGDGGVRDTQAFKNFRRDILKRDHWTCQICRDCNHKGRGSRIILHVDHIEPICFTSERALDPTNARTLCFECHKRTETYGPKVRHYVRKRLKS
jgi:5-methylcytosine-specific restriction endonuclease McrA